jgi:uncharacterized protein YgiM (DUF1202 family)
LAQVVISSHYAEPIEIRIAIEAFLRDGPSDSSDAIRQLTVGEKFLLLNDTLGWAWGYAGDDRRVGYVESAALQY